MIANNPKIKELHTNALEHHLNEVLDMKDSPIKFLEEGSSTGLKSSQVVSVGSPGIIEMKLASYVKDKSDSPSHDSDQYRFKM